MPLQNLRAKKLFPYWISKVTHNPRVQCGCLAALNGAISAATRSLMRARCGRHKHVHIPVKQLTPHHTTPHTKPSDLRYNPPQLPTEASPPILPASIKNAPRLCIQGPSQTSKLSATSSTATRATAPPYPHTHPDLMPRLACAVMRRRQRQALPLSHLQPPPPWRPTPCRASPAWR